ncbi:Metallo-dependent phosphatase-like protein [Spinellus fusiger]|nr:Metallo-dependent phosphatase-like protein [Spinellus fusiger]
MLSFLELRKVHPLVNFLRLVWVVALVVGEHLVFHRAANYCSAGLSSMLHSPQHKTQTLLLIGDPQLTDAYSYNHTEPLQSVVEFYSDRYLRHNYRLLLTRIVPETVFFMGDLMDSGRTWRDQGWLFQVNRFFTLFDIDPSTAHTTTPPYSKVQFMAGNHDLGFGNGVLPFLQERFESVFGPSSYTLNTTTPYSIVVIDTVSLSATLPELRQRALEVLLGPLPPPPRILMTHVPLYRSPDAECGPHRQSHSRTLRDGAGFQYQNLVSPDLSQQILEHVQPVLVFSGDDHDYCRVTHALSNGKEAVEMTVPTLSMAQGVRGPGVVVVRLSSDTAGTPRADVQLCWLPDQISVFIGYGWLAALSLVALAVLHGYQWIWQRQRTHHTTYGVSTGRGCGVLLGGQWLWHVYSVAWVALGVYGLCLYI